MVSLLPLGTELRPHCIQLCDLSFSYAQLMAFTLSTSQLQLQLQLLAQLARIPAFYTSRGCAKPSLKRHRQSSSPISNNQTQSHLNHSLQLATTISHSYSQASHTTTFLAAPPLVAKPQDNKQPIHHGTIPPSTPSTPLPTKSSHKSSFVFPR